MVNYRHVLTLMWWCLAYLASTSGGEWHGLIWQSLVSLLGLHASFALDMRFERPKPHGNEHSDHGVTESSQLSGRSTEKQTGEHNRSILSYKHCRLFIFQSIFEKKKIFTFINRNLTCLYDRCSCRSRGSAK